jgi:hypothetical protein
MFSILKFGEKTPTGEQVFSRKTTATTVEGRSLMSVPVIQLRSKANLHFG